MTAFPVMEQTPRGVNERREYGTLGTYPIDQFPLKNDGM